MILFYQTADIPYGCFSNFSKHPFVEFGRIFKTSEHYFQSMKYLGVNQQYFELIVQAKTPKEAAQLGRSGMFPMRSDWELIKDSIMYHAVFLKFTTYASLQQILLSTGDEELVEDSPVDSYWGWGYDHKGKNKLGKILMRLRSDLRNATSND